MLNNDHDDDFLCGHHLAADDNGDAADHHTLVGCYNAQTHLHHANAAAHVVDGVGCSYQNTHLLCCHGGLPLAGPGKDLTGISRWFHEVGTRLYFDKELAAAAEHSLARQVEPYSHHHVGKELVEHTAAVVDCSRSQDDDAEHAHLLSDTGPGLFSYLSCC